MADDQLKEKPKERFVVSPDADDGNSDALEVSSHEISKVPESDKNSITPDDALIGTTIAGQYLIDSLIGSGGMGSVYKATDLVLGRTVALKLLNKGLTGESLMRFQQEGRTISKVNHVNVASVYNIGTSDDGAPYMVMEYISGEPLSAIIKNEVPLNSDWIFNIASQVLNALATIHESGVIHRDLKPENILIWRNEQGHDVAKIVDFGIARELQQAQAITKTGAVMGSPLYMSPEQCAGQTLDAQSDIYSAACIIFEMLAGKPPFQGDSVLETMHCHASEQRPTLPRRFKHLNKVMTKALSIKKADRYQSARTFFDELTKAHVFHWRKIFLQDPFEMLSNMNTRQQSKHPERTMTIFWSLLLSIFIFSIVSITQSGAMKQVAGIIISACAVCLLLGLFWRARSAKSKG